MKRCVSSSAAEVRKGERGKRERDALRQIEPSSASTASEERARGSAVGAQEVGHAVKRERRDALSGAPLPTLGRGPGCSSRSSSHVHAEKRCPSSHESSPP